MADVSRPVIGADLLKHYGFIVDVQGKRLIDKLTQFYVPGFKRQIAYALIKTIDSNSTYHPCGLSKNHQGTAVADTQSTRNFSPNLS